MPSTVRESLSQQEVNHLEGLGFSKSVIDILHTVGFLVPTMEKIATWTPLMQMLDEFVTHYNSNHLPDDAAVRAGSSGFISLNKGPLIDNYITIPIDSSYRGQREAVYSLAHELTHVLSKVKIDFSSAVDLANSINLMEGEAYCNTMIA